MKKLEIKAPCSEDWTKMQGGDKKKYCASCEHHVEDFTDKSIEEIVGILENREGRTCGRLRASQLNPIKKIAAAVMIGGMLAGCQPDPTMMGDIGLPHVEIDTTSEEKTTNLPQNEMINTSEHTEKYDDILLGDTILVDCIKTGIMGMYKED